MLGDLIPNACFFYHKDSSYKIQFLEVENEKVNWENYLLEKKEKYEKVSQDFNTWDKWWRKSCERLDLPMCKVEDFCFSVLIIGDNENEWG